MSRSRRAALAVLALGLAAGCAAPLAGAGAARADAGTPGVDRVVLDPAIVEDSGLAISPQHPGVLWTMNDSGNPPVLFAVDRSGATVARLTLTGVPNVDWEAVAAWRDGTGRALLAAADIGDNAADRSGIEVDVLAEPATLASATLKPLRRLRLRYPDRPSDAEALMVDPRSQRMFLATKGFGSRLYAVPAAVWPGLPGAAAVDSGTLEPVGRAAGLLVTDGAILSGGQVVLRTYASLLLLAPLPLRPVPVPAGTTLPELTQLGIVDVPSQRQGEGLAVEQPSGGVLLSSEGPRQPVLRIGWPAGWPAPGATVQQPLPAPDPGPAVPRPSGSPGRAAPGRPTSGVEAAGTAGTASGVAAGSPREPLDDGRLLGLGLGSAAVLAAGAVASAVLRRRRAGPRG